MFGGSILSRLTGWILCASVVYVGVSIAQNISSTTGATSDIGNGTVDANHEIDFETLSLFGVTPEFAEQFRLNLLKAIEAAKEEYAEGLRQGEFGGVQGGFFQGGGGQGGGGAGGAGGGNGPDEEASYEDEEMVATTPGPGAFGVLSGIFGIFSGLGTLSPSRIIQSTVNFFPPGQRMMAQMIVDSLIGYTPPENRTIRPRPRTRRTTTTPLPMIDVMIGANGSEIPTGMITSKVNETEIIVGKEGETSNGTSGVDAMSEVISAPTPEPTTSLPDFINVHDILDRTTPPPPPPNEDDETDFEKTSIIRATLNPSSNTSATSYKLKPKATPEEEESTLNVTTVIPPSS